LDAKIDIGFITYVYELWVLSGNYNMTYLHAEEFCFFYKA